MLRRLGAGLLLLAVLLGFGWAGLVVWARGPGARALLEAELSRAAGLVVTLEAVHVGWLGGAQVMNLRVADPHGAVCLHLPSTRLDWRFPVGDRAPLVVRVEGGTVEFVDRHWADRRLGRAPAPAPAPSARPAPASGALRLAATGTMEVPAERLVLWEVAGVVAQLRCTAIASEYRLEEMAGRGWLERGEDMVIENLQARLAGSLPLTLRGRVARDGTGAVEVELGSSRLGDLGTLMPLSAVVVQLGAQLEGRLAAATRVVLEAGQPPHLEGHLEAHGVGVRLGGEPLLEAVSGRWDFAGAPPGDLAGELRLEQGAGWVFGLPVEVQAAAGRLEVGARGVRVSRLRGDTPLGSTRLGYRLRGGEVGLSWALTLDAAGYPGGWLRGATAQIEPAGMRLQGIQVSGGGLDLVVDAEVLPEAVDPPTWRIERGVCVGTAKTGPVHMEALEGILYLDSEGGYSFNLEGQGGVLRGQRTREGDLRLWLRPEGQGTFQEVVLASGAPGAAGEVGLTP